MARLCRVHLAGMGEACARFHPLTLDFRHTDTGAAQDSVLWLRNGGGKTTLISIFYSVLVPNQNHFLGRLLGKRTTLPDFLRVNELGVVVCEWEFPKLGLPRRVIGQVMVRKEHDWKRRFFSYAAVPGFGLEELPVLGLGQPVRSIEQLLDRLREAEQAYPAMDLVLPTDQGEWERHLELVGLDPFLFEMHLKMNKQEGGASDLFKLKAPEDFLRLFLELVFDERATEELERSLGELREKIARAPDRAAAIEFGEEILKVLRPFAAEATQRQQLRERQRTLRHEVAQLAAAVAELLQELDRKEANLEIELANAKAEVEKFKTQREQRLRYARGYERRRRELLIGEMEAAWQSANRVEIEARARLQLLTAAVALRAWWRKEAELAADVKQLDRLKSEYRPEWESVRELGATVHAAWDAEVEALTAARAQANTATENAKANLQALRQMRETAKVEQAQREADKAQAISALSRHDEGRRKLVTRDVIEARESAAMALARWKRSVDDLSAAIPRLEEEMKTLRTDAASVQAELTELAKQIRNAETAKGEAERARRDGDDARERVAELPLLRELCEGDVPNLRNPHLLASVEEHGAVADARLVELGLADFDDRRSLTQLDREGLLAPSVDVAEVLRRVTEAGAPSALSLYRWLAEHRSVAQALELLRAYPAIYSGILLQNPPELDAARKAVEALQIKQPVLLVTLDALPPEGGDGELTGCHTVLPAEYGLFSTREAGMARPRLEQRRLQREEERETATAESRAAREAVVQLRDFLERWPQSRFDELSRVVETCDAEIVVLSQSQEAAEGRKALIAQRQEENQQKQLSSTERMTEAKGCARELETFVTEHEAHAERWRDQREKALSRLDALGVDLASFDQEEPRLAEAEAAAMRGWLALSTEVESAKKSLADLPREYVGERPRAEETRSVAELEPEFRAAVLAYEGKVQKGELDGRIAMLNKQVAELRQKFENERGDVAEQDAEMHIRRPGLDADLHQQQELVVEARAKALTARQSYDAALAQRPEQPEYKGGSDLDPQRPVRTSQECEALVEEMQAVAAELQEKVGAASEQEQLVGRSLDRVVGRKPVYAAHQSRIGKLGPARVEPHAEFSLEDDGANAVLVNRIMDESEGTDKSLSRVENAMRRLFEEDIHKLLTTDRFAQYTILMRERLQKLGFEDLASQASIHVNKVGVQVSISREELATQEQEKRILVQKLDLVARQTANLFEQAERVSEMPDALGPWARQPFLRISLPRKNDPKERHILLGQAVDRWFDRDQSIPRGADLAFQCLLALCGTKAASVRILKPEYELRAESHDIMDLVVFSDGEKLTTAIVLYCILVRLRARQKARAENEWESDAGLLLLDNPFGKATLPQFVDMQIRMARLMGVQLIYATGVGDFGALKAFPHYVRLRNSSRGKLTGDYHVTVDGRPAGDDSHVEGVTLGFQSNHDGTVERG